MLIFALQLFKCQFFLITSLCSSHDERTGRKVVLRLNIAERSFGMAVAILVEFRTCRVISLKYDYKLDLCGVLRMHSQFYCVHKYATQYIIILSNFFTILSILTALMAIGNIYMLVPVLVFLCFSCLSLCILEAEAEIKSRIPQALEEIRRIFEANNRSKRCGLDGDMLVASRFYC